MSKNSQKRKLDLTIEKDRENVFYDPDLQFKRIRAVYLMNELRQEHVNMALNKDQNTINATSLICIHSASLLKSDPQVNESKCNAAFHFLDNQIN